MTMQRPDFTELPVHVFGQRLEVVARFGHIKLQRHFLSGSASLDAAVINPVFFPSPGGPRRIPKRTSPVFLVYQLGYICPVPGRCHSRSMINLLKPLSPTSLSIVLGTPATTNSTPSPWQAAKPCLPYPLNRCRLYKRSTRYHGHG